MTSRREVVEAPISDERLAELILMAENADGMWSDESSRTALMGWRELHRLRELQRSRTAPPQTPQTLGVTLTAEEREAIAAGISALENEAEYFGGYTDTEKTAARHAAALRALANKPQTLGVEWVAWSNGDALPVDNDREYSVIRAMIGVKPFRAQLYVDATNWARLGVIAYWPIPLPPPFQPFAPATPGKGACECCLGSGIGPVNSNFAGLPCPVCGGG